MKKNLIVKQDGYKECGAASLLSIIRYYHGNISINRLIEMTYTDKDGTNFYNLKNAAEKIGLEANGYKVEKISSLLEIKNPFICQLLNHNYEHFVVVYEIKKNKITVMDPAVGIRYLSLEEFSTIWTGYIMIFSPKKKIACYKENKYLNNIIVKTIKKNRSIVLNILLLSIIFTIFSCLYALYFQVILDSIIDTSKNNLLIFTFLFSILLIIKCISSFFRNELLIYLNQKLDCSIFLNTFQKLLLLPYNYYKNRTTGEIISRINDLIYVKNMLSKLILTVFLDLILFLVCGILLFFMNYILFILLIIIIMIYVLIFYIFRPILKRYTIMNQNNTAKVNSYLIESINGFETIKNMNMEEIANDRMEKFYVNALNDSFNYDNISNLELFIKEIVSSIGVLLIEFLGFSLIMNNQATVGEIITYTALTSYFLEPIKNIINLNKEYYYATNSLKRANHLFEIDNEDLSTKTNFTIQGNICFHHLFFSYNEEKNILQNLSLSITQGSKVIILGNSGSGKSTLLKLLLKYYPVTRNCIYLDQVDINDYSIKNVRENIGCVSQNEILYTDTIKNNIVTYRNIVEEKFLEACQITCVDEFVKSMFLGYDTKLEENGLNLSGGQRQRIILARMLLGNRKIMLIDEGLNAIDVNLERKILKQIFKKYKKNTIIIISHRLENLDLFNQVVHLENGILKEITQYPKEKLYD